jgi:hypothetical protein
VPRKRTSGLDAAKQDLNQLMDNRFLQCEQFRGDTSNGVSVRASRAWLTKARPVSGQP